MEAFTALELIEKLESALAGMYSGLRLQYADDTVLSGLFGQLEKEERDHAGLAADHKGRVAGADGLGDIDFSFTRVQAVLNRIAVVRAMPKTRLAEILVQCYVIESSLVEQYVVAALRESNREIRELLDVLSNGFRDHLTALAAWIRESGGDLENLEALRRHPRVSISADVTVNEQFAARSVDVSESGFFLLTPHTFRQGELITVRFPIAGGVVSASARVRYSVPNKGIGAAFSGISDRDRELIRRYVDECLQKQAAEVRKKQAAGGAPPAR